jgi:hypothetical protein
MRDIGKSINTEIMIQREDNRMRRATDTVEKIYGVFY